MHNTKYELKVEIKVYPRKYSVRHRSWIKECDLDLRFVLVPLICGFRDAIIS